MNEAAGDWICTDPSCGNINFARRVSCYRCNKDRPDGGKMFKKKLGTEIGKSAAEKSRGLFNADDWQCNKCANVNWARRTTCNVCNAPKFGEVEARTGYGGGYNERGVVEYRRREPSSDDEYDEFGRKKRKRKLDSQNAVGITEGPLAKKLPPALLQMDCNMDAKEDPAPNVSMQTNRDVDKARSSLSDSSICDLPPLSKMAFRRHQLETQTNYNRPHQISPAYKTNGTYLRKRFPSATDQDSLNNKIASKIIKQEINSAAAKSFDLNKAQKVQIQPSKNDVIYKFTGSTPTEDFEVTYSIEERVKVAAYAIVHNNCRISTDKFEALYDKPAPDFKTIFAWRQRLLKTGCLDDSHISVKAQSDKKNVSETTNCNIHSSHPLPNPEEIPISSDSEMEYIKTNQVQNNTQVAELLRSTSADTLVIGNNQKGSVSSCSTAAEQGSQVRSHSSPHCGARSSSRESRDSTYSDSDLDKVHANSTSKMISNSTNGQQKKQSIVVSDSESDSISYDSDYVDFLSRVYGDGKKPKSSPRKRQSIPVNTTNCESSSNDIQVYKGYCTVNKSEQSPLATGNIYVSNVPNMQVKGNTNVVDTDGGSGEYVPTKLVSSTKKNYQDFKNNVKKKGFWAKGNCTTAQKNKQAPQEKFTNNNLPNHNKISSVLSTDLAHIPLLNSTNDGNKTTATLLNSNNDGNKITFVNSIFDSAPEQPQMTEPQGDDFTNDDFEQIITTNNYTSFDKPLQSNDSTIMSSEDSSRIFDVVQSNLIQKNRSIMEIFDVFDDQINPETNCEENEASKKPYIVVWDEDDDALYKDEDAAGTLNFSSQIPHNNFEAEAQSAFNEQTKSRHATDNSLPSAQNCIPGLTSEGELFSDKPEMISSQNHHDENRKILNQVIQTNKINRCANVNSNIPLNIATKSKSIENKMSNVIHQSKKINIIESITITPEVNSQSLSQYGNKPQPTSSILAHDNNSPLKNSMKENNSGQTSQADVNLSSLLAGINTDTLLLALQNLQQLAQKPADQSNQADSQPEPGGEGAPSEAHPVETINLTNDEDWEKESDREGSIERQLKKLHGNTGDTPFLSDIFDPGPVVIPPNVARKLNINNQQTGDSNLSEPQENIPVIGNFKSFALPKPIMLNRLKLTVKQPDKTAKHSVDGRKRKRKKKSKASTATSEGEGEAAAAEATAEAAAEAEAGEDGDEEESGDDADLSKYDLWGSDDDKGHSSKTDATEKAKDGEEVEAGSDTTEKNGKTESVETKTAKRRSRSSSSSSSSSSTSSSSHSSVDAPKNKFDDFNLNSEREASPPGRRSRSHSPHARGSSSRRKPHTRASGDRSHEKQGSRDRDRRGERERRGSRSRSRSRSRPRPDRKERRYSRDGAAAHYGVRGRHR